MRLQFYLFILLASLHSQGSAQNLFLEECFEGGVTAAGRTSAGLIDGYFKIQWDESYTLKSAFAITYRYSDSTPITFNIDDGTGIWNNFNQIGSELPEVFPATEKFAVHAQNITPNVSWSSDSVYVFMDGYQGGEIPNNGWFSIYCVFLYESPSITDTTCVRIYTADQVQYERQDYSIPTPNYKPGTDVGLAVHSDRLGLYVDRGAVMVNNEYLGAMWGADGTNPLSGAGVRGHFYYENETLTGLDDDTANATVHRSDGLALINSYLNEDLSEQTVSFFRVSGQGSSDPGGANPHPSFTLTYTPECEVIDMDNIPRTYTRCRGDTIQPSISGYDHYAWSPVTGLSDTAVGNPLCYADTSRWYSVRMWSDDEDICPQTIPIFVDVKNKPEPSISVQPSTCPESTGSFVIFHEDANAYVVNGTTTQVQQHTGLPAGTHEVGVIGSNGCNWEGTVEIPLVAPAEASFTINPPGGDAPLNVFFQNQSSGATGYEWLIDGEPISTSENISYTFADSGTYEMALAAWFDNPACADTVFYTLRVDPGMRVLLPNVVTPNGDGRNDNLVATIKWLEKAQWAIFNRWGREVHRDAATALQSQEALELWDIPAGATSGTYSVVVTATGISGKTQNFGVDFTVME